MRKINNISGVGFICRKSNPCEVFLEVKDDGHPIKLVRRQLCPIGGNWIGEAAKHDSSPLGTFRREALEELSFERPRRSTLELAKLGMADVFENVASQAPLVTPLGNDVGELTHLKQRIILLAKPFGDHITMVSKEALDAADPANKRDGFTSLACYFIVELEDEDWDMLVQLQRRFGNLSNEAVTVVTSLDEILKTGVKFAFAHDGAMRRFFRGCRFDHLRDLPSVPGCTSQYMGLGYGSYTEYLKYYEVAKRP